MKANDIATIVLSYRAQSNVIGAVRSLLEQGEPTGIVVVNSGGGSVRNVLRAEGIEVPCLDYRERLFAGGARNRGIAETSARYVAFLAADCRARPGWIQHRLAAHGAGARTVASAIVNSAPQSRVASAAHLGMFMRRLPRLPAEKTIRFGASYERSLFDEFGLFDETLRSGEDTEFLERLPAPLRPVWDGRIQTEHLNETRLLSLLRDQFCRGVRYGKERQQVFGARRIKIAKEILRQPSLALEFARQGLEADELATVLEAMPILRAALLARATGALLSGLLPSDLGTGRATDCRESLHDNP
ncbi:MULTISPECIES: glycosyltransferase family 2 protein [Kaistia]|uniref:Glycosyltransferase family A protein n=1 Tax=Kaistia nematophila TaxID=2994654 RepID=A0A9X3EDQ7_9HYPH|nr:glycosyltransferase family A protein [Kaistia nematophila]MCX5571135.1 glycosyltransferase family A protein [Kaistia nematophila]